MLWDDRERYHKGWGVYDFPVEALPTESTCPITGRAYTFFPKHEPLDNNYAHTEIWCDDLPRTSSPPTEPTKAVKKELRAIISQSITIRIEAQV